jgi:hypothetical protein
MATNFNISKLYILPRAYTRFSYGSYNNEQFISKEFCDWYVMFPVRYGISKLI